MGYLSFEDGLKLVSKRAIAMQKACEQNPSTMAAVLGLENEVVENICNEIKEVVVPANYNCPGQLVISGSNEGIDIYVKTYRTVAQKSFKTSCRWKLSLPFNGTSKSRTRTCN